MVAVLGVSRSGGETAGDRNSFVQSVDSRAFRVSSGNVFAASPPQEQRSSNSFILGIL